MDIRTLGRDGPRVSRLGIGLAAVGRPAYINRGRSRDLGTDRSKAALEARAHAILDAAVEAGIRYLDVARSYGLAEAFLGSWLRARGSAVPDVVVGSKWGYTYVGEWRLDAPRHEVKDHGLATLRRQLAETRALLGDRLTLYQVHSATLDSGILTDPAVLAELVGLVDAGLLVGLSVSGPGQAATIERALAVEIDGRNPFSVVQATWNVLEPSVGPALAAAHTAGWGVIVKEALANGRLVEAAVADGPVGRLATAHGTGPDAIAVAAVLAQPWADVVLSGAATVAQLRSNAAAVDVPLDPGEVSELLALAESPESYWQARSELPWA